MTTATAIRTVGFVSILTRPEGRVLLAGLRREGGGAVFQSSPGPKAGCYKAVEADAAFRRIVSILTRPEGRVLRPAAGGTAQLAGDRFNPHPARRPGATPESCAAYADQIAVSILTRPEGRVLRATSITWRAPGRRFNPHPARRPGATRRAEPRAAIASSGFNPHPARRPGATARWSRC